MFDAIAKIFGGRRKNEVEEVQADFATAEGQPEEAEEKFSPEASLLAGELRAARKIQMSLVPRAFPPIPGCLPFDLYAILEPAQEIGGDFYDFWLNGKENLVLVVGDVSGKGIPAALFMAICRTYLRAFSRSIREPARLVECLNNEVSRHNDSCMFVTLICAVIHLPTGKVTYTNAGHNPPFIRRRDGSVTTLEAAENTPVGFMTGVEFSTRTFTLQTGESFLLYTDGMPEAFNLNGEVLGEQKSLELFQAASSGGSCRTAIGQIRAEISEFVGANEQSDDITLLMYSQMDPEGVDMLDGVATRPDALEGDTGQFGMSRPTDLGYGGDLPELQSDLGLSLSGLEGHDAR